MRQHPEELERRLPSMVSTLKEYMKSDGQGSANPPSDHEACIAEILERHGCVRVPRGTTPTEDGFYYQYQLQGSQKSGDFLVFQIMNGKKSFETILDAKHSNNTIIYLNDGTFEENTIYIISFTRLLDKIKGDRKKPRQQTCFIALGQHVMTEKDRMELVKWREALKLINTNVPDTNFLRLYARSANQYNCHHFTKEIDLMCWTHIEAFLAPSV